MIAVVDSVHQDIDGNIIFSIHIPASEEIDFNGRLSISVRIEEVELASKSERFLFEMNKDLINNKINWEKEH